MSIVTQNNQTGPVLAPQAANHSTTDHPTAVVGVGERITLITEGWIIACIVQAVRKRPTDQPEQPNQPEQHELILGDTKEQWKRE